MNEAIRTELKTCEVWDGYEYSVDGMPPSEKICGDAAVAKWSWDGNDFIYVCEKHDEEINEEIN